MSYFAGAPESEGLEAVRRVLGEAAVPFATPEQCTWAHGDDATTLFVTHPDGPRLVLILRPEGIVLHWPGGTAEGPLALDCLHALLLGQDVITMELRNGALTAVETELWLGERSWTVPGPAPGGARRRLRRALPGGAGMQEASLSFARAQALGEPERTRRPGRLWTSGP